MNARRLAALEAIIEVTPQFLAPEQEALLPLIDGHRDINGLIRDSGLGEFEVGKALYGLFNTNFLLPVGRKRTTPTLPRNASPLERRELASALYRAGMHEEAQREFRALVEEAADPVASFHVGLIALRRTGIYFAMITVAIAEVFYFVEFNPLSQWTGG